MTMEGPKLSKSRVGVEIQSQIQNEKRKKKLSIRHNQPQPSFYWPQILAATLTNSQSKFNGIGIRPLITLTEEIMGGVGSLSDEPVAVEAS